MKKPRMQPVDAKRVQSLLQKYNCPVPYHAVRTRFLGNIATPSLNASPISAVKGLWDGNLPEFESMGAVNELVGILINGLWNALTRHQRRSDPFRLVSIPMEATRAGLASYAQTRREEIDGFVYGLFDGKDEIDVPSAAQEPIVIIGEIRAMLSEAHALAIDESKVASDEEAARILDKMRKLTPLAERAFHVIILECTRARRQTVQKSGFTGPRFH